MSPGSLIPVARVLVPPGKLMDVKVKDPLAAEAGGWEVCADAFGKPSPNARAKIRHAIRTRAALYLEADNRPDRFIYRLPRFDTSSKRVRANFQSAVSFMWRLLICFSDGAR